MQFCFEHRSLFSKMGLNRRSLWWVRGAEEEVIVLFVTRLLVEDELMNPEHILLPVKVASTIYVEVGTES